ncbi:MAG TPA: cytochrome d ubiquinol oxidase subunit II [Bacteroidales bacterium]|nr:cytochrome d ubiquinol oxidase subunit II [Bacteroidales bacterium]HPS17114.1 cytochrome d ubiquinol oxidase subunit II [Bacteroidales bacterium]
MFETLSLYPLQQYWWALISMLAGLLVFLFFVQGGQTLIGTLSSNDDEKNMLINSLGRKWEFTFTTLVTFGGAMFAAFPLFYATSFGGAYWVWVIILFCFIIQAVSYEFRRKPNNFLGTKVYDIFLFINGSVGVILLGTAIATFFTGSEFSVSDMHLSKWQNQLRGIEAAFNFDNLALGIAVFFLARVLALLYFINNIDNQNIYKKALKQLKINTILFLIFFLYFVFRLIMMTGFSYNPTTKIIFIEPHKYLNNFFEMPIILSLFFWGIIFVLVGIIRDLFLKKKNGIWYAGSGTVLTVFSLLLNAGYNHTSFYPSTYDLQSSLTIENASSSHYTLTAMSYVSLMIPFVLAYIFYAWKIMDKKKIDASEIENDEHAY